MRPVNVESVTTLTGAIDNPTPAPTEPDSTPTVPVIPDPTPDPPVGADPATPGPTGPPTPIDTTLPETGTDVGSWFSAAIGLILLGCVGVRIAQRPRRPI